MENYGAAAPAVSAAQADLRACLVSWPAERSVTSEVLRELAVAPESLSGPATRRPGPSSVRLKVTDLRAFLWANDRMFGQVRRSCYGLGLRYALTCPRPTC